MTGHSTTWSLNDWLFELEHRHTVEIHLGLERVSKVAELLDVSLLNATVITVGGTNGKGSTIAALEEIYTEAGYRVGAYTSPHLLQFNERIRVQKNTISDDVLCQLFSDIEGIRGAIFLSYFETATLAALLYFKRCKVDVILLEVGLGGRLDATNCVDSALSIITTIDFDHQEFLGDTLEAIGYEKAGILRANKPFIYADDEPPASIEREARRLNTKSYYLGKEYTFSVKDKHWLLNSALADFNHLPIPKIQLKSAAAAIMASVLLHEQLPVQPSVMVTALSKVFVPGRQQLHLGSVSVMYDVSHNPQSARLLAERLKSMDWQGRIFAVFSALKDKDLLNMISPLKDCVHSWFPAQLDMKRAIKADDLLHFFKKAQIDVNFCYTSPILAFQAALNRAKEGDLIVVFGSFYTVSHVMTDAPITKQVQEIQ